MLGWLRHLPAKLERSVSKYERHGTWSKQVEAWHLAPPAHRPDESHSPSAHQARDELSIRSQP